MLNSVLAHDMQEAIKAYLIAFVAFWGGLNLNDWSIILGLVIVCLRLPIEAHNLFSFLKRRRHSNRRRYDDKYYDEEKNS